jgi:hypothetical protein
MNDAINQEGEFANLHKDIADALNSAFGLYSKYYDLMDSQDIYYIVLMLNPRYKTCLLEQELGDDGKLIVQNIKGILHREYPPISWYLSSSASTMSMPAPALLWQKLEAKLLAKIQRSTLQSDIVRYFNDPLACCSTANSSFFDR